MREKILENKIGIFQGRLTDSEVLQNYPSDWRKEIFLCEPLGYSHLEFFLEEKINIKNPFWKKSERLILKKMYNKYFSSKKFLLCDNYLIKHHLYDEKTISYLKKVFQNLLLFNYSKLILPLHSKYFEDTKKLAKFFNEIFKFKSKKIEISFEIDADTNKICNFFALLKSKFCGVTFDTGNIFLKNKSLTSSFIILKQFINHIHIKDRNYAGENVALGTGLLNFKNFFNLIKREKYNNTITLETFRKNNAIIQAKKNNDFLKKYL